MTVTVTDQRTIVSECDATTGWTGSVTISLLTADPTPIEATGCLGQRNNNTTTNAYFTIGSTNLTNQLIYAWFFPRTVTDTKANGGMQVQLGDGTNRIGFHLAGNDVAGFRHDNGPTAWQCLLLDVSKLATYAQTVYAGSFASLNVAAITQVGIAYKATVAAQGTTPNTYWDVVRSATAGQGLLITGGTSGASGKFSEIATADQDTANQKAFGVLRKLGTGLYGCQGPLTFGDSAGTTASYFAETDATLVFEDRGIGTDKYSITVQGNATGSTTFKLGVKSGSGDAATGTNGCALVVPTGVGASFTATDADLQFLLIYGSTLSGFSGGITLSSNATNGPNHEFMGNIVSACGVLDPGRAVVRNCRIVGWSGASTDAALLWGSNTNVKRCAFTSSGTGHAIKVTAAGTYTFDGLTFSGYGADGSTDACVYNNSGGAVTINVVGGGNTPTVRNGAGATTTVNSNVSVTLTGLKNPTEVRVFSAGTTTELAGQESVTTGSFSFSVGSGVSVDIAILSLGYQNMRLLGYSTTSDTSVPIAQQVDRQYANP